MPAFGHAILDNKKNRESLKSYIRVRRSWDSSGVTCIASCGDHYLAVQRDTCSGLLNHALIRAPAGETRWQMTDPTVDDEYLLFRKVESEIRSWFYDRQKLPHSTPVPWEFKAIDYQSDSLWKWTGDTHSRSTAVQPGDVESYLLETESS